MSSATSEQARPFWRVLASEPLVHFLALGALVFALQGWFGEAPPSKAQLTIGPGEIANISALFERTWGRPPSETELSNLIDARVREEVLYREALAMGLDDNDTIVRRRLVQKLEFLSDDLAARIEPDDAALQAFLEADPERFRRDGALSFAQVFLDPTRHRDDIDTVLAELSAKLEAGAPPQTVGDRLDLPTTLDGVPYQRVASSFGRGFAQVVATLPPGAWQGPVPSAYGLHLVRLDRLEPGGLPPLAEIREQVLNEWRSDQRQQAADALYEALASKYAIEIVRAP